FSLIPLPPNSTLFPYTTLFRSGCNRATGIAFRFAKNTFSESESSLARYNARRRPQSSRAKVEREHVLLWPHSLRTVPRIPAVDLCSPIRIVRCVVKNITLSLVSDLHPGECQ